MVVILVDCPSSPLPLLHFHILAPVVSLLDVASGLKSSQNIRSQCILNYECEKCQELHKHVSDPLTSIASKSRAEHRKVYHLYH